jgi:rod shape-determining protein MreB and related proteins
MLMFMKQMAGLLDVPGHSAPTASVLPLPPPKPNSEPPDAAPPPRSVRSFFHLPRGIVDLAIDLGTVNTSIHVPGAGVVLSEPSVVAVDSRTRRVLAVGLDAKRMLGRSPAYVEVIRPMRGGAIGDVDLVDAMLRCFLERVTPKGFWIGYSKVLITAPSGITEMERRALREGALEAGAARVFLLSEPIAAAVGAGLPVSSARGSMVVNVGGGTTEIGVISLSGMAAENSIRLAGLDLDEAIAAHIRRTRNLLVGELTAEAVKLRIGSAFPDGSTRTMEVSGRDIISGVPATCSIYSDEIRDCLREPIQAMVAAITATLEVTPPELAADIVDDGIVLTGAGAQLRGLWQLVAARTGLAVRVSDDPSTAVVRGAGAVLEDLRTYLYALGA